MSPVILGGAALLALLLMGGSKKKSAPPGGTKPAGPYIPPSQPPSSQPPAAKPKLTTFSFRHPDGSREVWGTPMSQDSADKSRSVLVTQAEASAKAKVIGGKGQADGTYSLEEVSATGDEGMQVSPHIDWSGTYTYNGLVGKAPEVPTPSETVNYVMKTPSGEKVTIMGPISGAAATPNEDNFAIGLAQQSAIARVMGGKGTADGTYQLAKNLQILWTHVYTFAALGGSSNA